MEGIKFYGSPWQPWYYDWAFNEQRGEKIKAKWDLIPEDTDVLITHGPPMGILDKTLESGHVGCEELVKAVHRIKPKLHIFGHIHEDHGELRLHGTHFVNAASCNLKYKPV